MNQFLAYHIPFRVPFRGLTARDGLLLRGSVGWGEFSPFWDYDDAASAPWLACALEAADVGWPTPVRTSVPVNVIVPAVSPEQARELVTTSGGCRTAKVKVAQRASASNLAVEPLDSEVARIAAVREALADLYGKGVGKIRVDANGGWTVAQAIEHIAELAKVAGGLEYVEQPCQTVAELAQLRRELARRGIDVPVAADESIRLAADPFRVRDLAAADIAVLKVAPLGGVRAALRIAEQIRMPVVVSSAIETSIGLAAGLALAGALPELPYACGLATANLLTADVVIEPLLPHHGHLPVLPADSPRLGPTNVAAWQAAAALTEKWQSRFQRVQSRL